MSAQISPKFHSFNWMRGVSTDLRITIVHRLILIRLLIERQNDGRCSPGYDAVAADVGVDRRTIFRAVDAGIRCGWLAPFSGHGGRSLRQFVFTFPVEKNGGNRGSRATDEAANSGTRVTVEAPNSGSPAPVNSDSRVTQQWHQSHGLLLGQYRRAKNRAEESDSAPLFASLGAEDSPATAGLAERPKRDSRGRKESAAKSQRISQAEIAAAFEGFYGAYPRKVAKDAARKAYDKAVERGATPAALLSGAQRYAAERKGENPKYTKHPATWLNAGCWEDEPTGAPVIDQAGNVVAYEQPQQQPRRNGYSAIADRIIADIEANGVEQYGWTPVRS
jgi:hypothetical protein